MSEENKFFILLYLIDTSTQFITALLIVSKKNVKYNVYSLSKSNTIPFLS